MVKDKVFHKLLSLLAINLEVIFHTKVKSYGLYKIVTFRIIMWVSVK